MKIYLLAVLFASILLATAFTLVISGDNLGEDFYRTEMIEGYKVEIARLDQFALHISIFAFQIFALLALPALIFGGLLTLLHKFKVNCHRGDAR